MENRSHNDELDRAAAGLDAVARGLAAGEPDASMIAMRLVRDALGGSAHVEIHEGLRTRLFRRLLRRNRTRLAGRQPRDSAIDRTRGKADTGARLAALPLELREALLLVTLAGMSYAEVAETLDIPRSTVLANVASARSLLLNDEIAHAAGAAPVRPGTHLRVIK